MANRYWVGGAGTWDTTSTTNWSATSGGASGASVPTLTDSIFFDQAGTYNVTLTGALNCLDWTVSSGAVTFVTGTTPTMTVYGNVTWGVGTVAFSGITFSWNFSGSGTKTITTNGVSVPGNPVSFGSPGIYNLGSAFTTALNLAGAGSVNTNNYALTFGGIFGSGAYNWGSSTVTSTGSSIIASAITLNAGTSTLICTYTSTTNLNATTTGLTFNNVVFTSTSQVVISNTNTFNNLTVYSQPSVTTLVQFNANQTINGSLSTVNTAGNRRIFFASATYGLAYTLTINGTPNLIDADFRDLYIRGGAFPLSGTRFGNRGNCTGINFSIPKTVYWNLAGAQNWSANGWATTPTGTPSTDNFPLPQDTATFTNAGSVTGTITIDAGNIPYVPTVDMSGRTTAMTLSTGNPVTCYGNWTNGSGTTFNNSSGLTFSSISPGQIHTVTSAGKIMATAAGFVINTYGGTVQLADALNIPDNSLLITNGTFNTMGYAVTAGLLSSSNSNVRTINLGASTVTLNGIVNKITCTTTTGLTFNAGTSNIIILSDSGGNWATVDAGSGLVFYDVSITGGNSGSTDSTLLGACTFRNLTFVRAANDAVTRHSFNADITVTGTLTISTTTPSRRIGLKSSNLGTPRTITAGAFSGSDCDFQDIILAGAAAGASPTRAGNCGGNSGITFPSAKTVYWNLAGTQNWYSTAWCTSTDGGTTLSSPDVNNFPLAQDTAVINNVGSAGTITIPAYNLGTFDASSRTTAVTITPASGVTVFGDWKFGTGVTSTSNTNILTFAKNGTQTITSNGVQFGCGITINNALTVVQLADALSLNSARTLTLTLGTFDAVSYNVTTGLFSNGSTANTLKMGSGTWTVSGTGSLWNLSPVPTLIAGTSTIVLSDTSTTARIFTGGSQYYNKLTIGGSTGTSTLTISGSNIFGELASTKTVAHTILFGSGTTNTIGKWSVAGIAGNVVTVGPGTAATIYTINIAGPANTVIDYLSISYCAVSTTSPGEFYVGANSTNTAGNTGAIVFTATPSPRTLYWVGGTGNWSATTSWSTASGGSSGAAIPTSLDSVNFNSASNATAYTATIDAGVTIARCAAFNMAGPASGNVTFAGTIPIAFHGNVTFAATGITRSYTGTMYWAGNSSYTFTTNGLSLTNILNVTGINSTWTLGSALTSANSLQVAYGNFNTSASNYALSVTQISSSNSNVRGFSLNGSTVTLTASGSLIFFPTSTNLTFNAGTSSMTMSGFNLIFNGGDQTFSNVSITSATTGSGSITGANIFNNLTITGPTTIGIYPLSFSANNTINGTLTLGAGTTPSMRNYLRSDTIGTQRTLTCAAISSVTDVDFRDINFAGAMSLPVTGTRLGDCKGNSNIIFGVGKTVYYRQTGTANWGASPGSWSLTSGGAVDETAFPLAQDTAVFPAATYPASGSVVSINDVYNIGTIDMSLRTTNTMTITASSSISPSIYGNWINGSGITFSLNTLNRLTFAGRTTQGITTAGKTWTASITIETPGGSVVLQDAFVLDVGTTNLNPDIKYGTFDANGYNVTMGTIGNSYSGMNSTGSNVRALNFGSGTWNFQHGGNFMTLSGSNLTISGTGTINVTSTVSVTFAPGGFSLSGMTLNLGGSGQVNFAGDCTLGTITRSYTTAATTLNLSSTNLKVGSWTAKGTAAGNLTITGTSASSPATLIYTGSGAIPNIDYVVPTSVRAYPTTSTWYAAQNSTNGGSLGWLFSPYPQPLGSFMVYF